MPHNVKWISYFRYRGQLVSPPCLGWDCLCVAMGRGWMWCSGNTGSLSASTPKVSRQEEMTLVFFSYYRLVSDTLDVCCEILIICFCIGRYIRSNLNMPSSLPPRSGGHRDYDKDCPITVFGSTQAHLVGQCTFFWCCLNECVKDVPCLLMQSYHRKLNDLSVWASFNTVELCFPKTT